MVNSTRVLSSGGRKTAMACVEMVPGSGEIYVNGKSFTAYFQENSWCMQHIKSAWNLIETETKYNAYIKVRGGGLSAQAQSIRLALAKAFSELLPSSRTLFKRKTFLTRDARAKERRKYGLKKARKAPQYSKR